VGQWHLLPVLDTALLIVSELVTNAVLYANTPLTVTVSCSEAMVEIAVVDDCPELPVLRSVRRDVLADIDALLAVEGANPTPPSGPDGKADAGGAGSVTAGRGLLLISILAAEWGVTPQTVGKAVWARIPTPPGWSPAASCTCGDDADATPLASGSRARHDPTSPLPT
jgi:hypothetical protein